MAEEAVELARREIAYCETLLAKGGLNVLSETFRDTAEIKAWDPLPDRRCVRPDERRAVVLSLPPG